MMQGILETLTQDPLYFAQIIIFSVLIIIFMASIIVGFLKNRSLKKRYWEELSEGLLDKYVEEYQYEDAGGSGWKVHTIPKKYLSDLTILLALQNRENLLHPIITYFRPDYDKLAFSGSLKKKTQITLEIIQREGGYIKEIFKEIVDLETVKLDKRFDSAFLVKSSAPYAARGLFLSKEGKILRKYLLKHRDSIRRIAVHREAGEPALNGIFYIKEESI